MKEELYGLANHIASAKGGLPQEWQDWAEEIEADLRKLANREAQPTSELAAPSAGVYCPSDSAETIEENPKSWAAWKREAERLQAIIDANREAQPVGKAEITKIAAELVRGDYLSKLWTEAEKSRHVDTHRLQNLLDELHDVMKVKAIAITRLLTAPPAPAVPDKPRLPPHIYRDLLDMLQEAAIAYGGTQQLRAQLSSALSIHVQPDHPHTRAAMLAQPVSGGYKLVPAEATEDMIAAAMNCDDVSFNADETFCVNFGNIYAARLAAAPEGGNDHDTRR